MRSDTVIRQRLAIEKLQTKLYLNLKQLQDEKCPHHNLTYVPKGTERGWDYDAEYWYDWKCSDCDKRWRTEQTLEEVKKYPQAVKIDIYARDYKKNGQQ